MIDKRLLIHSVTIEKVEGVDEWGKESYSKPLKLAPVRFDRSVETKHVDKVHNEEKTSKLGTVYVYPTACKTPIDDSFLNAKVSDGMGDYRVTKITTEYHPMNGRVFCYELDVI